MGVVDVSNSLNQHRTIPSDKKANILNNGGSGSGKYYYPDNELSSNLFDQIAANYHKNGFNFFLIEVKTVYFNMFLDFDFAGKMNGVITSNFIFRLHEIVWDVFSQYFPTNDWDWQMCDKSGYEHKGILISKNKKNSNLHFNFPFVQVDIDLAKRIVFKMMEKLYFHIDGDWHSFVDCGLYKSVEGTGLRILGCPKYKNGNRMDDGYRLLKLRNLLVEEEEDDEDENGEVILNPVADDDYIEPITLQHLELCSIRNNVCTRVTPHQPVENTMTMAFVKTDDRVVARIKDHITHKHVFAKQINHNTFIFRNIGARRCMVGPEFQIHSSNNFFVKKQSNGEYRYYCLSEKCRGRYRVLFKDEVEENFDPKRLKKIADEYEEYDTAGDMKLEMLNYLNLFFSYIEELDVFVQTSKEGITLYKNLQHRLQYCVGTSHEKSGSINAKLLFCSSVFRKEYKKLIFLPYLIKSIPEEENGPEEEEEEEDGENEENEEEGESIDDDDDEEDDDDDDNDGNILKFKRRRIESESDSDADVDSGSGSESDSESDADSDADMEEETKPTHLIPVKIDPRHLNMFNGFMHTYDADFEIDHKKIQPICDHLRYIWCGGNETLYKFLIGYFACIVRFPASHPAIALVVHSDQGAGKGCIMTFLRDFVIGPKWASSCSEMEQLTGKFTAILLNKLLITCDEINNFGGGYKKNNRLKNLISERTQSVEKKNHDPFDVDVFCRFNFLSNFKRIIKVEPNCRRFLCLHAKNKEKNKGKYFKYLHAYLESKTVGRHFFHFLANWNEPWDHFKIPMTQYRQDLMRKEIPTASLFLFDQLTEGSLIDQIISLNELYATYENAWCPQNLDFSEGKTYKKLKSVDFHNDITTVYKIKVKVVGADDDDDDTLWFQSEQDSTGLHTVQTFRYNIPGNCHDEMMENFKSVNGFWDAIDIDENKNGR